MVNRSRVFEGILQTFQNASIRGTDPDSLVKKLLSPCARWQYFYSKIHLTLGARMRAGSEASMLERAKICQYVGLTPPFL
jgi:hypothetical protein